MFNWLRGKQKETSIVETKAKNKDESASEYEIYFNYSEKLSKIPPHRILAINRAENENIIKSIRMRSGIE